jgi:hypothetical protein
LPSFENERIQKPKTSPQHLLRPARKTTQTFLQQGDAAKELAISEAADANKI